MICTRCLPPVLPPRCTVQAPVPGAAMEVPLILPTLKMPRPLLVLSLCNTSLPVSRYVDPHPVAVAVGVARACPSPFLARGLCGLYATSGRGTAATVRHHK